MICHIGKSKRTRLEGGGRTSKYEDIEKELREWIDRERSKKHPVSRRLIFVEAHRLFRDLRNHGENTETPHFTESWMDRFLVRHGFTLRRKTTACQKDPEELIPKIVNFVVFVRQLRVEHDYADIIACDETPIWLDFVSDTTVNRTGAKEVSVITTGHEKTKLSVMLAAKSNGVKLKPHIVINRVRPIDGLKKLSHKIHVTYAKKGLKSFL
jgi:hypothetical protein